MIEKLGHLIFKLKNFNKIPRLIKKGLIVGKNFQPQVGCIIDPCHCWLIRIGNNVTLAPRVHILAHDASTLNLMGYSKVGLVIIGDNVFIGAGSIILPNVRIGNNVIIGAGSVVTKDIPDNTVAVGNPAEIIAKTDDFIAKNKENLGKRPIFDRSYSEKFITQEKKNEMIEKLRDGIGYHQ